MPKSTGEDLRKEATIVVLVVSYGTDCLSVREWTLLSWSHCVLTQDLSSAWGPSNWPSLDIGQVTGRTMFPALDLPEPVDGWRRLSPATRQDRETTPGQVKVQVARKRQIN